MDENLNANIETDSNDIARKAEEAFREFELKQKTLHEQQQKPEVEISKPNINLKFEGINEIEESLKKFEEKSRIDEKEKQAIVNPSISKDTSMMARFVIKNSGGLIREERQAEYILLVIAILAFLASGYLFYLGVRGNVPKNQQSSPQILNQTGQIQPK